MYCNSLGLSRHICWDAAQRSPGKFNSINFAAKNADIGFALMNQLATAQKRFPQSEQEQCPFFPPGGACVSETNSFMKYHTSPRSGVVSNLWFVSNLVTLWLATLPAFSAA